MLPADVERLRRYAAKQGIETNDPSRGRGRKKALPECQRNERARERKNSDRGDIKHIYVRARQWRRGL